MIDLQDTLKQLRELADKGGSAIFFGWEAQALLDERDTLRKACEALITACNEQANFTGLRRVVGKALEQAEAALLKGAKHE